jgi:hypothetical protein
VTDPVPTDQEFVVHLFAAVDGPHAIRAHDQIAAIWEACRDRLGMNQPILGVHLPMELPTGWRDPITQTVPLAGQEHAGADCQAILRREHDLINLSVVFAPPQDTTPLSFARRLRIGAAIPPGWIEFNRWWDEVASEGTDALLGIARIYQAKVADPGRSVTTVATTPVLSLLPRLDQDDAWWDRPLALTHGINVWEPSAQDDLRTERRLIVLAPGDRDPQLSALTWSRGDTCLPPLARYLMHAAKLRYELRVWSGGRQVWQARQELADQVKRLSNWTEAAAQDVPPGESNRSSQAMDPDFARLTTQLAAVGLTMAHVRQLRQTIHVAAGNMVRALDEFMDSPAGLNLFSDDQDLATWLLDQIDNAITDLDIVDGAARRLANLARLRLPEPRNVVARTVRQNDPGSSRSRGRPADRTEIRLGFTIDIAAYSDRSQRSRADAQERVANIVGQALRDMGLHMSDTDHQGTGDGLNAFLPAGIEVDRALPHLVRGVTDRLAQDNQRYRDRLRLRMAAAIGPVRRGALGYADNTIIEFCRLVDSKPLRDALAEHPEADLAVLFSDVLHRFAIRDGESGLDPNEFRSLPITVKTFHDHAWLWIPQPRPPAEK